MPITSRTVRVEGLQLHVREAGSGPPLVLLHGWPTSSELWRHIQPVLAEHRRVIAPDLPGFGRSDKPLDGRYGFTFHTRVLDGLLTALDVDEVGLVVHDLGGPIGLRWAVEHPERVRELAVLNTLCFPELHWTVKAFVAALSLPGLSQLATHPQAIAAVMRFGVHRKAAITREVAGLYTEPFQDRASREALARAGRELSPRGFRTIADGLPNLDVPTRLIYGARDRVLPDVAQTMDRLHALWPHAELTVLPDAGHFLQEDAPQHVARLLADWLEAR